jgi:hypothetical protein
MAARLRPQAARRGPPHPALGGRHRDLRRGSERGRAPVEGSIRGAHRRHRRARDGNPPVAGVRRAHPFGVRGSRTLRAVTVGRSMGRVTLAVSSVCERTPEENDRPDVHAPLVGARRDQIAWGRRCRRACRRLFDARRILEVVAAASARSPQWSPTDSVGLGHGFLHRPRGRERFAPAGCLVHMHEAMIHAPAHPADLQSVTRTQDDERRPCRVC